MKKIIMVSMTLFFMTSCATILNTKNQEVNVRSRSNKMIVMKNQFGEVVASGQGKIHVLVPRSTSAFNPATYTIESGNEIINVLSNIDVLKGIVGNIFVPGTGLLFGGIIDGATGAIYELKTDKGLSINNLEVE